MQIGDIVVEGLSQYMGIITETQYQMDSKVFYVVFFNDKDYEGWYGDTELEIVC